KENPPPSASEAGFVPPLSKRSSARVATFIEELGVLKEGLGENNPEATQRLHLLLKGVAKAAQKIGLYGGIPDLWLVRYREGGLDSGTKIVHPLRIPGLAADERPFRYDSADAGRVLDLIKAQVPQALAGTVGTPLEALLR